LPGNDIVRFPSGEQLVSDNAINGACQFVRYRPRPVLFFASMTRSGSGRPPISRDYHQRCFSLKWSRSMPRRSFLVRPPKHARTVRRWTSGAGWILEQSASCQRGGPTPTWFICSIVAAISLRASANRLRRLTLWYHERMLPPLATVSRKLAEAFDTQHCDSLCKRP